MSLRSENTTPKKYKDPKLMTSTQKAKLALGLQQMINREKKNKNITHKAAVNITNSILDSEKN